MDRSQATISGRTLVFRLFLALWVATLLSLLWFAQIAKQNYGDAVTNRVYYALIGDLLAPIIAWFIFKKMNAKRESQPLDGASDSVALISDDGEE